MLTPYTVSHKLVEGGVNGVIPIMYLGSRGLFTALIGSLISTEIYVRLMRTKLDAIEYQKELDALKD